MSEHFREEEFIPYLDSRLSEAERARLARHLAACAACRIQLEQLRGVLSVLGEWQAVEPSAGFDAALRARLADEAARPEPWLLGLRPTYAAALAVVVVVAVGIGLWQWAPPGVRPPVAQTPPGGLGPPPGAQTPAPSAAGDDLAVLDNPVLLENYELLDEFDVLFEPAAREEKKL